MEWIILLATIAVITACGVELSKTPIARRKAADEFGFDRKLWLDLDSRPMLYARAKEQLVATAKAILVLYETLDEARIEAMRAEDPSVRRKADQVVLEKIARVAYLRREFRRLEKLTKRTGLHYGLKADKQGRIDWRELAGVATAETKS